MIHARSLLSFSVGLLLVGGACGGTDESGASVYLISGGPTPSSPAWRGTLTAHGRASAPEHAVRYLLRGPAVDDTGEQLVSAAPKGTTIAGVDVRDGVATVRLASPDPAPKEWGLAGTYLTAQVVFTLTEFPSIERVRMLMNGRPCCLYRHDGQRVTRALDRDAFESWEGAPDRVAVTTTAFSV